MNSVILPLHFSALVLLPFIELTPTTFKPKLLYASKSLLSLSCILAAYLLLFQYYYIFHFAVYPPADVGDGRRDVSKASSLPTYRARDPTILRWALPLTIQRSGSPLTVGAFIYRERLVSLKLCSRRCRRGFRTLLSCSRRAGPDF